MAKNRVCPFGGVALVGTPKNPLPRWDFGFLEKKLPMVGTIFRDEIAVGILVGGILKILCFTMVIP